MGSKRKRDYLFLRPGSQYWRVRFQAGGRSIEKSLGTTDRAQAEVLALPMIAEHKARLLAARPRLESSWLHKYAPGREHASPDGGRIVATDHELIYLNHAGAIERTESNRPPTTELVNAPFGPADVLSREFPARLRRMFSKLERARAD